MSKNFQILELIFWGVLFLASILCIVFLSSLSIIPTVVDATFGNQVVANHIQELALNGKNSSESAKAIIAWGRENIKGFYGQRRLIGGIDWGIYLGETGLTWSIRDTHLSWMILAPGNCGEHAHYFVHMMNLHGFESRAIRAAEDHEFAEYLNEKGEWVIVDTSSDSHPIDSLNYGDSHQWSHVSAYSPSNITDREDITWKFSSNITNIELFRGETCIKSDALVGIYTTQLQVTSPAIYKSPLEFWTSSVEQKEIITLRPHANYVIAVLFSIWGIPRSTQENLTVKNNSRIDVCKYVTWRGSHLVLPRWAQLVLYVLGAIVFFVKASMHWRKITSPSSCA